jgi:hypothetical protein
VCPLTASRAYRKWHGYNAYIPENIIKVLDIFRVFYNYVGIGEAAKLRL